MIKKKYKIPEFLLPEEITLDLATRIISYKKKISEVWLEKQIIKKLLMFLLKATMKVKAMVNLLLNKWF